MSALKRVLLSAVHASVWLRVKLALCLAWLWTAMLSPFKHKGDKLGCIIADVKDLQKLPLHLALVVQEREVCQCDLARVVAWAFSAGIHCVSLYEHTGGLKQSKVLLESTLAKELQSLFSAPLPDTQVLTTSALGTAGTDCDSSTYKLLLLSAKDGQRDIVSMATSITQSVLHGQLSVSDVDSSLISRGLVTRGFPDPDLVVVFGPTLSLSGFPPWQTRLTEVLWLPSHHKVSYQEFLSTLQRYARCQQRFGK